MPGLGCAGSSDGTAGRESGMSAAFPGFHSLTFLILESPPGAAKAALAHPILVLQHGPTAQGELGRARNGGLAGFGILMGF